MAFPNLNIALRTVCTIAVSALTERSISKCIWVKQNDLRTTMNQERFYCILLSVIFIAKSFTFYTIVNGTVVNSTSNSLSVYRNTTEFCILTLYPAISLNSLIVRSGFFTNSSGSPTYTIRSSVNEDSFYLFLSNLDDFCLNGCTHRVLIYKGDWMTGQRG